jgi:nucleoside-diphosphate-sugar epimerase
MKERVLITGGAGYIGSILAQILLEYDYNVTVIDNLYYKQESSLNHLFIHDRFEFVRGDVRVEGDILPLLKKADVIIPLAALVGAPICDLDPVGATTTNRDAIFFMMKNISKEQRIIMPTTNSAYGSGDKNNFCTEESPLNPISRYAKDKVEVEEALMQHPNAISMRLATVFGMSPRMRIDLLVNDFVHRAVKDGFIVLFEPHFKRNYIHVRDVCRAFLHAMNKFDDMRGNIYNIGLDSANLSKMELCERIKLQLPNFTYMVAEGKKDPDQRNYIVSNEKIKSTQWMPIYDIDRGIKELISCYKFVRNNRHGNV